MSADDEAGPLFDGSSRIAGDHSVASQEALLLDADTLIDWNSFEAFATSCSPFNTTLADCVWQTTHSPSPPLSADHIPLPNALVLSREEHHALRHFQSVFAEGQTLKEAPWSFPGLLLHKASYSAIAVHCALAVSLNDLDARNDCQDISVGRRRALIRSHFSSGSAAFRDAISLSKPFDHVENLATFYLQYAYLTQQHVLDRSALDNLSQTVLQYLQAFAIVDSLTDAPSLLPATSIAPTPALRALLCRILFWIYKEDVFASAYRCAGDVARYFHGQNYIVRDIWELSRPALALGWGDRYPADQLLKDVLMAQFPDMHVEIMELRFDITELSRSRALLLAHAGGSPSIERKMALMEVKYAAIMKMAAMPETPDTRLHHGMLDAAATVAANYYGWKLCYHRLVGAPSDIITPTLSALLGSIRRVTRHVGVRDLQGTLLIAAVESKDPIHRDWIMGKLSPWKRNALSGILRDDGGGGSPVDIWEVHDLAFDRGLR